MLDYDTLFDPLFRHLKETRLSEWAEPLKRELAHLSQHKIHGDLPRWQAALDALPEVSTSSIDLNADRLRIGEPQDMDSQTRDALQTTLKQLHPWRKGPYDVHGVHIDTEWHSDWKWQRLSPHISPLKNRLVLDVGCGNGYHCWRMLGEGAELVVGIDPSQLFLMQFQAMKHFIGQKPAYVLPLGVEAMPDDLPGFDTVFSMGVFYHRRSPIDHLYQLRSLLRPGGELVLETLIIEGENGQVLVPSDRYAQMRNVWFLPSVATLESWMRRCGYKEVRTVDINQTSTEEQRTTEWMTHQSLPNFLDPDDPNKTVEGYPAPTRAVVVAKNP